MATKGGNNGKRRKRPFGRILVPIPSERFPAGAVKRAMQLAAVYDSELLMLYIIEENVIRKLDQASEMVLTTTQREKMESTMVAQQKEEANKIHFIRVKKMADSEGRDFRKYIRRGKFGNVLLDLIREQDPDLILMEYRQDLILKFHIMNTCPIPLWIEKRKGAPIKEIMGVCTNRAPNKVVPRISKKLAMGLDAHLTLEYIVDSEKDEEAKIERGRDFLQQFYSQTAPDVDITIHCQVGPLGSTTKKLAKKRSADLIIMGRAELKRGFFGFKHDDKVELARGIPHSILMIN